MHFVHTCWLENCTAKLGKCEFQWMSVLQFSYSFKNCNVCQFTFKCEFHQTLPSSLWPTWPLLIPAFSLLLPSHPRSHKLAAHPFVLQIHELDQLLDLFSVLALASPLRMPLWCCYETSSETRHTSPLDLLLEQKSCPGHPPLLTLAWNLSPVFWEWDPLNSAGLNSE